MSVPEPSPTQEHQAQRALHTPGPWSFFADGGDFTIYDDSYLNRHIASTSNGGVPQDQVEANTRLIAAAPELLEALRACRSVLDALMGDTDPLDGTPALRACQAASAAIAKATEEQS